MNNQWLPTAILKLLSGLPLQEANAILHETKQLLEVKPASVITAETVTCANAFRRGRKTKLEQYPEVKDFILSLPYLSQSEILLACKERFGLKKIPSRSSLCRFLKALRGVQ